MINIRLLDSTDIKKYKTELINFMQMVLSENTDQEIPHDLPEEYVHNMEEFIENKTAIIMGAFDEDKIIGFHWGYETKNLNERRIHSYFNAIENNYRGQKIGSRFFARLEEEAKKRGIYIIEAMCTYDNKIAVNYHLHNGFEIERLKVKKVLKDDRENTEK